MNKLFPNAAAALDADVWGYSIPRMLGVHGRPMVSAERKILPLDAAGGEQHHERHEAVLPEAALLFDAPCLVHGARNGAEYAKRRPEQRHAPGEGSSHAGAEIAQRADDVVARESGFDSRQRRFMKVANSVAFASWGKRSISAVCIPV